MQETLIGVVLLREPVHGVFGAFWFCGYGDRGYPLGKGGGGVNDCWIALHFEAVSVWEKETKRQLVLLNDQKAFSQSEILRMK